MSRARNYPITPHVVPLGVGSVAVVNAGGYVLAMVVEAAYHILNTPTGIMTIEALTCPELLATVTSLGHVDDFVVC